MINAVIYGYGNIGRATREAIEAAADFRLAGVVSSSLQPGALGDTPVVRDIAQLPKPDVVILCAPKDRGQRPAAIAHQIGKGCNGQGNGIAQAYAGECGLAHAGKMADINSVYHGIQGIDQHGKNHGNGQPSDGAGNIALGKVILLGHGGSSNRNQSIVIL